MFFKRFSRFAVALLAMNVLVAYAQASSDNVNGMPSEIVAICAGVKDKVVPGLNLAPDAATPFFTTNSKDEDCEDLYYAPGRKPDYNAARRCALMQNDRLVLIMLYANGYGVHRDVATALKIACISGFSEDMNLEVDGSPFEVQYRIEHLASMLEKKSTEKFDQCDDAGSGYMEGRCAHIAESFKIVDRARRRSRIIIRWNASDKAALATLEKAKQSWIDKHASEVDVSGTGRAAFEIEEQSSQEDKFIDMLALLEQGHLPNASSAMFEQTDEELNTVYRATQNAQPSLIEFWGTVTPQGIREAERAWVSYRDAWVTFAAQRYPSVSAASIKTYLTRWRIDELKGFADAH